MSVRIIFYLEFIIDGQISIHAFQRTFGVVGYSFFEKVGGSLHTDELHPLPRARRALVESGDTERPEEAIGAETGVLHHVVGTHTDKFHWK